MIFEWWQLFLGFIGTSGLTAFLVEIGRKFLHKKKDDFEFYKLQIEYLQGEVKEVKERSAEKSKEISTLWSRIDEGRMEMRKQETELRGIIEDKNIEIRRLDTELNIEKIEKLEAEFNRCDTLNCPTRVPPRSENSVARERAQSYIDNYKKNIT